MGRDDVAAWTPTDDSIQGTNLHALMSERGFETFVEAHAWSVREPEAFKALVTQAASAAKA